jgi:hypothetical protein
MNRQQKQSDVLVATYICHSGKHKHRSTSVKGIGYANSKQENVGIN